MMQQVHFMIPPPLKSKMPVERVAGCAYETYSMPNVFMLYQAAVAFEAGWNVRFKDFVVEKLDEIAFRSYLRADKSDVYIFHSVNLSTETDLYAAQIIRQIRGDAVFIIFSGPAPTLWPQKFCTDENVIVIRGEPEATLKELLEKQLSSLEVIDGISYYNGGLMENPPRGLIKDLDSLPFPRRELLNTDKYFSPKLLSRPFTTASISRNCPHKCYYCVPCSLSFAIKLEYRRFNNGKAPPVRKRSPENVREEFALLRKQGHKAVSILDDQFIWNKDWTINVVEAIGAAGVEWGCATRPDYISQDVVRVMAENGCRYIDLGVESFNQAILDDIQKDLSADTIAAAIEIIKKSGICAKINVLIGASPLETKETISHSIKTLQKLKVNQVMYNIASPYPGTEFYDIVKRNGWFRFGEYVPIDVQSQAQVDYPDLSGKEMERLLRRANFRFFLSPAFIMRNIWRLKSFTYFKDTLGALGRKLIR